MQKNKTSKDDVCKRTSMSFKSVALKKKVIEDAKYYTVSQSRIVEGIVKKYYESNDRFIF